MSPLNIIDISPLDSSSFKLYTEFDTNDKKVEFFSLKIIAKLLQYRPNLRLPSQVPFEEIEKYLKKKEEPEFLSALKILSSLLSETKIEKLKFENLNIERDIKYCTYLKDTKININSLLDYLKNHINDNREVVESIYSILLLLSHDENNAYLLMNTLIFSIFKNINESPSPSIEYNSKQILLNLIYDSQIESLLESVENDPILFIYYYYLLNSLTLQSLLNTAINSIFEVLYNNKTENLNETLHLRQNIDNKLLVTIESILCPEFEEPNGVLSFQHSSPISSGKNHYHS